MEDEMTTFKVGDRVAVYTASDGCAMRGIGILSEVHLDKKVVVIDSLQGSQVSARGGHWYHFKQCRKLLKKRRQRMWVSKVVVGGPYPPINTTFDEPKNPDVWIEFVEVKKKC